MTLILLLFSLRSLLLIIPREQRQRLIDVLLIFSLGAYVKMYVFLILRSICFLLLGYQRELTYQHFDGSFSAFGDHDNSGSMW